ncbi:hypothetical protein N9V61_03695 [Flavobacteriaceae bacterium]|uniref:hypothetical protein n=1 Tax=Candidatus Arcticimaribacter forsetii TaxID=2820661 RepID=UPI002076EA70|nr:hypothetical protein [Candidatus Arcticimaribacter forsetii]MDB2345903.1 hypothetical protein [Flavobacteriaceae bacterium]MDB4716675.1 hypothetical protein [Flavobacteriaceae bacterium]
MLQLYFYISLLLNPFLQRDIDTTTLKSFSIKGESYYFGSFNEVYQKDNDVLVQIDKSLDSRVSINSYLFKVNDTVFKYGGYGFWSDRNFIYYFDLETKEWEYFKTKQKRPVEGSSKGYFNQKGNKTIFYGGMRVDNDNRLNKISSNQIIEFDYDHRELLIKGTLDFPIRSKNLFYQGFESTIFYDTEHLYRVNPFDNTVKVYKNPKFISFIKNVEFDSENDYYIITKTIPKTGEITEIQIDNNFFDNPIQSVRLYKTKIKILPWLLLSLLIIIFYIIKKEREKSKSYFKGLSLFLYGEQYKFEPNDILVIRDLLKSNKIYFNHVMDIYSNPELSYGHNTRVANKRLDRLSIRLQSIFKLEHPPIEKIKSLRDRRQKIVVLTKEFISLNIIFK